jgi:hypothetical protein
MKFLKISLAMLFLATMIYCGSSETKDEADNNEPQDQENAVAEDDADATEDVDYEALAMKGLKAYQSMNLESLKSMAFPAAAINMDEDFIKSRNEEYMQNWDGNIISMKFRNDFGMKQALAYYADVPDSEEDEVFVYIVQLYGSKWFPSSEFDEIPRAEYEALPNTIEDL